MKKIVFYLTVLCLSFAHAQTECNPANHLEAQSFGGVRVQTYVYNGECNFFVSLRTSQGEEKYFISDQGKLTSFVSSSENFPTSTNSRSTGSRQYYLRPITQANISLQNDPASNRLTINMANGERMIINTASQTVADITGANWKPNPKGFREFRRNGQVIGEYVHDDDCINCGAIHPSLQGTEQTFRPAGILIDSLENGVLSTSRFRRGEDPRGLLDEYTTFSDREGRKCSIKNRYLYDYEFAGSAVDGMVFKFDNDVDRVPTRNGALNETLAEFLARVCANKGIPDFDVSHLRPGGCPHCGTGEMEESDDEFFDSFSDIIDSL